MEVTTVRYKIAPHRVDENAGLVRAIFSQLHETSPSGLHYACLSGADGSFMHIVRTDEEASDEVLTSLESFRAFRAGFKDRAVEPSTFADFEIVGNFRLFE